MLLREEPKHCLWITRPDASLKLSRAYHLLSEGLLEGWLEKSEETSLFDCCIAF